MEIKESYMTSRDRRTNWNTSLWKIRSALVNTPGGGGTRLIVAGSLIAILLVLWWVT